MQSQPRPGRPRRDERRKEQAASIPDDVFKGGTPAASQVRNGLVQPWLQGTIRLWTTSRRHD